jgi:hypothetical protein
MPNTSLDRARHAEACGPKVRRGRETRAERESRRPAPGGRWTDAPDAVRPEAARGVAPRGRAGRGQQMCEYLTIDPGAPPGARSINARLFDRAGQPSAAQVPNDARHLRRSEARGQVSEVRRDSEAPEASKNGSKRLRESHPVSSVGAKS